MHTLSGSIPTDGILIDVELNLLAADLRTLRQAGQPLPQATRLRALVDTGAEITCVDGRAMEPLTQLGLKPRRFVPLNMPALGAMTWGVEYAISLLVIHSSNNPRECLHLKDQVILEQDLRTLGYQVLLGRDVLHHCLLVYDGPSQRFTFAY